MSTRPLHVNRAPNIPTALKDPDAEKVTLHEYFDGTVRLKRPTAERWLSDLNEVNRPRRKSHVDYLRRLIDNGEFSGEHPSPITFDNNGRLADGQHRLTAFLASTKDEVRIHLRCGMPAEIREHIDRGLPRTLGDIIQFDEDARLNKLIASIITQIRRFSKVSRTSLRLTPAEALAIWETRSVAILFVANLFKQAQRGVTRMAVAVALVEFYEKDPSLCEQFATVLLDKTGTINTCQPARKLRETLLLSVSVESGSIGIILYRKAVSCMKAFIEGGNIQKIIGRDW